jgi:hypothetical protein
MLITFYYPVGSDANLLLETNRFLSSNFDMKDIQEAVYVLGIEIHRDITKCALGLCQEHVTRVPQDTLRKSLGTV